MVISWSLHRVLNHDRDSLQSNKSLNCDLIENHSFFPTVPHLILRGGIGWTFVAHYQDAALTYAPTVGSSSHKVLDYSGDNRLPRVPTAPEEWPTAFDAESALYT